MKTIQLTLLAGLGTLIFAFVPPTKLSTLTVKPEASKIEWFAEKVTGKHNGTVMLKDGTLKLDGNKIVSGSFNVDMTSINVTDLEGEYKGKLEGHLKSPDFFDVQNHETATFSIKSVSDLKSNPSYNSEIKGDLTIKGITQAVSFPAKVTITDGKLAAYGELVIDRSKFDVRYGSPSFFNDLGDKAIMDEFTMKISIGAKTDV
ncbi:MAG: YceI family protein [Flavobacteriales bacterium]